MRLREEANVAGFGAGREDAAGGMGGEDDEDDGVAVCGEDADEAVDGDIETRFLAHLAPRGAADLFAAIDETAGQGPFPHVRLVVAEGVEEAPVAVLNNHADGKLGVIEVDELAAGTGETLGTVNVASLQSGGAEGAVARFVDGHGSLGFVGCFGFVSLDPPGHARLKPPALPFDGAAHMGRVTRL